MATEVTTGLYPFDPYGTNPENLVLNEKQALQTPGRDDFYFIIPKAAPFFVKSLVVRNDQTSETYVEGEDYVVGHYFVEAMTKTGRPIAGSIRFLKRDITGIVSLTYQTVGGEWGFDDAAILEELSNKMVNPLTRAWAQIDVLPVAFPPIPHDQVVDDLIGFQDVVDAIDNIVTAIQAAEEGQFTQHMLNTDNPHSVTKSQVGLGNVPNYVMASDTEGEEGIRSDRFMSPRATKAAIDAQALAPHNNHLADTSNPHGVTKAQVGLSNVENFVFATDQEAREASLSSRYMSPRGVGQALDEFYDVRLAPMLSGDPDNPTGVTKESIGLGNVENYAPATQADMVAGTRNDQYTTPLRVFEAIDYHALIPLGQHTANTNNPHGVTPAQIGTFTQAEIQTLIEGRLATGATATDSNLVFGLDLPSLTDTILEGKAGDSFLFDGRTFVDATSEILSGQADDALKFDGKLGSEWLEQIEDLITSSADTAETKHVIDLTAAGYQDYTGVITRDYEAPAQGEELFLAAQSFLLTHYSAGAPAGVCQLTLGETLDDIVLTSLTGTLPDIALKAVTVDVDTQQTIWFKINSGDQLVTLVELSGEDQFTTLVAEADRTTILDPTGDTDLMVSPTSLHQQHSSDITTLTDRVDDLISELTTAFDTATAEL